MLVRSRFAKSERFVHTVFHSLWKTAVSFVEFCAKMSSVTSATYDKICDIYTFLPFWSDKSMS